MNIHAIESMMAHVSEFLMTPVLLAIVLLFIYSLFACGRFCSEYLLRKKSAKRYSNLVSSKKAAHVAGYPIHNLYSANPDISEDELEVLALRKLEKLRITTRVAPMLGLIATMIPMGPALKALGDGNIQGISENLIIAFAAVIWGLVISTLTFWPASVKKRWYASELINIRKIRGDA